MRERIPSTILTPDEIEEARIAAVARDEDNRRNNRRPRYDAPTDPAAAFRCGYEGCLGERALAKMWRTPWNGAVGDLDAADVGGYFQARAVTAAHKRLIIHPPPRPGHRGDKPEDPFFLVLLHEFPKCYVRGWLYAYEAQRRRDWWSDPQRSNRWAYFVPQSALHPVEWDFANDRPVWIDRAVLEPA